VRLYPLYHPAAALYTRSLLDTLRADVARLPALLALGAPAQAVPAEPAVPEPAIVAEPAVPAATAAVERPDWASPGEEEPGDRQLGLF
jgi:DNA polymerase